MWQTGVGQVFTLGVPFESRTQLCGAIRCQEGVPVLVRLQRRGQRAQRGA
jgi:hypothetical protein